MVVLIALCAVFDAYSQEIGSERTLQLKIIADETSRVHCGWEQIIKDVVKEASAEFNKQLGIKLEIKALEEIKVEYDFTEIDEKIRELEAKLLQSNSTLFGFDLETYKLLESWSGHKVEEEVRWLKERVDFDDCDIVVHFSSKYYGIAGGYVDDIPGQWILIRYSDREDSFQRTVHTFIHELGHVFGAVHYFDESSIMYPKAYKTLKFDKINKKLILKHKFRNFKEQSEEN